MRTYELQERDFSFLTPSSNHNGRVCEFDRIRSTVVHTLTNYLPCVIEDFGHERSAFEPTSEIVRAFYAAVRTKYRESMSTGTNQIKEYRRASDMAFNKRSELIEMKLVDLGVETTDETNELLTLLSIEKLDEYLTKADQNNDDLSILLASTAFWEKWLASSLADRIKTCKIKVRPRLFKSGFLF